MSDDFRWEYITIISSFFSILGYYTIEKKFKSGIDIFLIWVATIYQPLYSLISIGYINLSFIVSSILIILLRSQIVYMHAVYISILFSLSGINYLTGSLDSIDFMKCILFICIVFSSLITGNYLANKRTTKEIFLSLAISYPILSIVSLILKYFGYDKIETIGIKAIRDTGYNVSVLIPLIFYLIFSTKFYKNYSLFGFIYLLIISSRTAFIQLIILILNYRKKIKGNTFFLIFLTLIIITASYIIYKRTIADNYIDNFSVLETTTLTRRMGVFLEIEKFRESPIFGNGFFYYMREYKEMNEAVAMATSKFSYAAFNHIGVVSTLSQSGIIGFLIFIVFPFYLFLNFSIKSNEDKLIKEIYILHFISFFISGSPIVTDFPVAFFYFLTVAYMYNKCKKQNKLFKFKLRLN